MSKNADENQVKDRQKKLKCHFTWQLLIDDPEMANLESRIINEIECLYTKYNVRIHNLLAYVKYLKGQNEEALEGLREAEGLIQEEHSNQSDREGWLP